MKDIYDMKMIDILLALSAIIVLAVFAIVKNKQKILIKDGNKKVLEFVEKFPNMSYSKRYGRDMEYSTIYLSDDGLRWLVEQSVFNTINKYGRVPEIKEIHSDICNQLKLNIKNRKMKELLGGCLNDYCYYQASISVMGGE